MATGAVLLIRVKSLISNDEIERLVSSIYSKFNLTPDDFYSDGPIKLIEDENHGPIPVNKLEDIWYDLNIFGAYYDEHYPRGDIQLYLQIAEWLEKNVSNCEVWYGHDVDDKSFVLFSKSMRKFLLDHFKKTNV